MLEIYVASIAFGLDLKPRVMAAAISVVLRPCVSGR